MKVPQNIKNKMRKLAKLNNQAEQISREIDDYFIGKGFDIELLRSGDGRGLEELDYGNDATDEFCDWFENEFTKED